MRKIFDKIIIASLLVSVPVISHAQGGSGKSGLGFKFENPLNVGSIPALINKILEFVVKVGTVIAVFAVIYCGFLFVTAQGNEDKISKAKVTFFWVIVGALILIGAEVLSHVICNTANQLGAGAQCN